MYCWLQYSWMWVPFVTDEGAAFSGFLCAYVVIVYPHHFIRYVNSFCHDFETAVTVTYWRVNCVIIWERMSNGSYSGTEPFIGGTLYYRSSKWMHLHGDNMITLLYQEYGLCTDSNTSGQNCLVINVNMFVIDVGWPGNQVWFPVEARDFPFFTGYKSALGIIQPPGQWVKWKGHEADHSRRSGAEVRNAWSCTSTALCSWCGARMTDYLIQMVMTFGGFVTQTTSVYCVVAGVPYGMWTWFCLACKALADMFCFVSKWN
jgi:hypothetical protein